MTKSGFTKLIAAALIIGGAQSAVAAVSPRSTTASSGSLQGTKEALDLPLMERLAVLREQSGSYENLRQLMFSKSASMDTRWKAVTAFGRLGREKSKADLARAMKAPEWYMRNAALVSMATIDASEAVAWARRLMSDKALVVRSAAVDVIAQSHDAASTDLLWQKLYAKENYRKKQSLFIRRRIVEALGEMEQKGVESKFVAILQDKDVNLHEPAIEALERITKKQIGSPGEPVQFRRAKWEEWYKQNRATL